MNVKTVTIAVLLVGSDEPLNPTSGTVHGVAVGTAEIKAVAADGGFEAVCAVTMTAAVVDTGTPTLIYKQASGNSWHDVGRDNYVNTYRGSYWIGRSMTLSRALFHLNFGGNISAINYRVSSLSISSAVPKAAQVLSILIFISLNTMHFHC